MNLDDSRWVFESILGYGHGRMDRCKYVWTMPIVKLLSQLN